MGRAERKLCFTVTGEFLTSISRKLWADDGEPEKAIGVLEAAFPGMSKETMFGVVTGSKKLTGDSNVGISVEADGVTKSDCGNDLSLERVLGRFRRVLDEEKDWREMATDQTAIVPSPKGPIKVPFGRTVLSPKGGRRFKGEWSALETVPHKVYSPVERRSDFFSDQTNLQRQRQGIAEAEKPALPEPERSITQDDGWLAPDGKFYPCAYGEHNELAWRLDMYSREMEQLGWIKVQEGKFFWDYTRPFSPTQPQIDAVFDFCHAHGVRVPVGFLEEP